MRERSHGAVAGVVATCVMLGLGCEQVEPPKASAPAQAQAPINSPTNPDFNRDGKADLLWQNIATGEIGTWTMDGTQYVSGQYVVTSSNARAAVAQGWYLVASADVNNDGWPDLIWHNRASGQVSYWLMQGQQWVGSVTVSSTAGRPWYLVGANDMNGDGAVDLIWQQRAAYPTPALLAIWYMNPVTSSSSVSVKSWDYIYQNPTSSAQAYMSMPQAIVGVHDMDGNGMPDLLIHERYQSGAANVLYLHRNASRVYTGTYYVISWPSGGKVALAPPWYVAAAADYNRDGRLDIAVHNRSTGQVHVWFLAPYESLEQLVVQSWVELSAAAAAPWNLGPPDCETWIWQPGVTPVNCPGP